MLEKYRKITARNGKNLERFLEIMRNIVKKNFRNNSVNFGECFRKIKR